MLTFLKQYKKIFIILSFPYLYVLFLLVAPTNRQIQAPGDVTPVSESVVIEGIDMLTQFHTIYIYSYYPMTPFQGMIAGLNETMDVSELSSVQKDISWRDDYLAGQIQKLSSLTVSVIKAYELASEVDDEIVIDYAFSGLLLSYRPSRLSDLKIGDEIIAINGEGVNEHTEESFIELSLLREATLDIRRKNGDSYTNHTVHYLLNDDEPYLRYYPSYEINQAVPSFDLPGLDTVIGGPSGGMMQTLSIYASLLKLNIGDIKIAGTGTILMSGNIGKIGGIRQKIYTGINEKVDLFFIPSAHLSDISDMRYPFDLIAVNTIEEAVQALHEAIS
ncbi:MAG: S16 family serine protease [Acholeplasmataceae bacterium]|jgi:PDZ domain-containing protein|nr:S16 family serine protease [Acholeplasmataceae bacterium]